MNYPDLRQSIRSRESISLPVKTERTEDGSLRQRVLAETPKRTFTVVHSNITFSEREQIMSHYLSHIGKPFLFRWKGDDQEYTVVYSKPPTYTPVSGRRRWTVTVSLTEV